MIAVAPNDTDTKTRLEALTEEVSASRLNLWSTCRLKFYFRYVLQVSKPPTPALHLGKVVHSILQQWNLARWRGEQLSSSAMIDLFVDRWTDQEPGIDWDDKEDDLSKKASLIRINVNRAALDYSGAFAPSLRAGERLPSAGSYRVSFGSCESQRNGLYRRCSPCTRPPVESWWNQPR
jgi:hypothetical protein